MLDFKLLTEKIEEIRIKNNIAGMSVAVTDINGTIYKKGFGFENALRPEVPTYPDAMYKIASMTKTVTAVVILRLCQEGILNLDIPVKQYLPWLKLSRPEAEKTMTLHHLLTHSSGLPKDIGYIPDGIREEAGIDEVIKATLPMLPMASVPGDNVYCYSNWGFNLAACVATTVTGKTLTDLYKGYILDPLEMDKTTFDFQIAATYPFSLPHRLGKDGKFEVIHHQRINMAYAGGGGLYSCAEDMTKWGRFLLRGGVTDSGERLLAEETFGDMCSKHILRESATGTYYGYGMLIYPFGDRYVYGHNGNLDPYNSSIFIDHKTGLSVTVLMNSAAPNIRIELMEMIFAMAEE
ncbi:MAG: serine hydrolase [Oscillospiraceae bacterium]|nr:serine hydrolase [Oscillospiraceae bacterium]